jgi:putative endonuclease
MFFVYMLASKPYGTLYTGSTSDLVRRVWEHKAKAVSGFTTKYGVDRLVWFERHETLETAVQRERRIKDWKRKWKIELIEHDNPLGSISIQPLRGDGRAATHFRWVPAPGQCLLIWSRANPTGQRKGDA